MKALKRAATDEEMLAEFPRRARVPDWFIKVEEFANGGWRVKARDRWGRGIEQTGGDSDVPRMLEEAERYAESVAAPEVTEPAASGDGRVATLLSEMTALVDRLRSEAQPSWSEWVEADRLRIAAGDGRGLDHFLSAFGGMGSLNDVAMTGHTRELCSHCWTLARELQREARG